MVVLTDGCWSWCWPPQVTGHVRLNGREYSKGVLKSMAGYVMQARDHGPHRQPLPHSLAT